MDYEPNMPMYDDEKESMQQKLYFKEDELPQMLKWGIGEEYYLIVKVEMNSLKQAEGVTDKLDKSKLEGCFQVKSVKAVDDYKPIDLKAIQQREFLDLMAKAYNGNL